MKCLYCNKEIEGRNKKAKYCCEQHKVNHHQNLNTARRKWLEEEVVRLNKIIDILQQQSCSLAERVTGKDLDIKSYWDPIDDK